MYVDRLQSMRKEKQNLLQSDPSTNRNLSNRNKNAKSHLTPTHLLFLKIEQQTPSRFSLITELSQMLI